MQYSLRAQRVLTPFLLVLFVTRSWANVEPFEASYETKLQEHIYVTATRKTAHDLDVSAAVTAVGQKQILAQGPAVIAELLRGQVGAFFQQTTPGQGIPIIRGLKGSQVLHMVDGMRLNNSLFRNAPNQYLGLVDSFAGQRLVPSGYRSKAADLKLILPSSEHSKLMLSAQLMEQPS